MGRSRWPATNFWRASARRVVDRFIEDAAGVLTEGLSVGERKRARGQPAFLRRDPSGAGPPRGERPAPGPLRRRRSGGTSPSGSSILPPRCPWRLRSSPGLAGRSIPLFVRPAGGEPGAVPGPVPGRGGVPRPPPGHGALGGGKCRLHDEPGPSARREVRARYGAVQDSCQLAEWVGAHALRLPCSWQLNNDN